LFLTIVICYFFFENIASPTVVNYEKSGMV